MRRMLTGKRAYLLSAVVALAALLAGLLASVVPNVERIASSWEREHERDAWLRAVPEGGSVNESEDIQERAQLAYNRLAYPTGKIPPGWRKKAKEQVTKNVPNGKDFKSGGKQQTSAATSSSITSQTSAATSSSISPQSVQPVDSVNWTSMGPAPIDNNAASGGCKNGLVTGRINALAVDPNNPAVAYAGATAGGLWETNQFFSAST